MCTHTNSVANFVSIFDIKFSSSTRQLLLVSDIGGIGDTRFYLIQESMRYRYYHEKEGHSDIGIKVCA
jgi:hypothetical protein